MDKMKNKRGADKILTIYWFVIIFIVAGAVVYMAYSFYGTPFDARVIEGRALSDQIANCLTNNGYLNSQIFSSDFQNNFLADCHINFSTEDFSNWKTIPQFYTEVEVYKFSTNSAPQYYGESGNSVSTIFGDQILNITEGNANLKTAWELTQPSPGLFSFVNKRNVNTIVVHDTDGLNAAGAIQAISTAGLSIHYMIDRDGTIYSVNNNPTPYSNAFVSESDIAQDVGCYNTRTSTQIPSCSVSCLDSNHLIATSCQALNKPAQSPDCCIDFNLKSVGIELVNLGPLCSQDAYKNSKYCQNSLTDDGKQWETYSNAQINALVTLVSNIAARYNIPLDRAHIIGHYQTDTLKTDPGPAFPWDQFMQELEARGFVAPSSQQTIQGQQQKAFYVLDKSGNQYIVQVLTLVGKAEKNE